MLLSNLGASLLRNLLTGKGAVATSQKRGKVRVGEGTIRSIIKTNLNLMVFI